MAKSYKRVPDSVLLRFMRYLSKWSLAHLNGPSHISMNDDGPGWVSMVSLFMLMVMVMVMVMAADQFELL